MRGTIPAALLACALAMAPQLASAKVQITIDLSSQTMQVDSDRGSYNWPISSAGPGYDTPRGHFTVQRLEAEHYSKEYFNSPMPHSIFFDAGFAIHGTYETHHLGQAVSHGCVRLSPAHAATLFHMVEDQGASIDIIGDPPSGWTTPATYEDDHPLRRAAPRVRAQESDEGFFAIFPFR